MVPVNELNDKIGAYRRWILKFCNIFHVSCVDLYADFDRSINGNYSRFLLDGLHPTKAGHRIIADIIDLMISKLR